MDSGRPFDPSKVSVILRSKTLWDELTPNWVRTLDCNCFGKEGKDLTREWHRVEYSDGFVGHAIRGSSLFVCRMAADWIRARRGLCCRAVHRRCVLYDLHVPSLFCTEAAIVCANKTIPPSPAISFIEPQSENMYSGIQAPGKGRRQQCLPVFKDERKSKAKSCQGLHTATPLLCFHWAFCVVFIKTHNSWLSWEHWQ